MKFELLNPEISEAALKDAPNFGLSAKLLKQEDKTFVEYESKAYCENPVAPTNPTWDDFYSLSKSMYSEMEYQLKWIREDFKYMAEAFYKHQEGHLPPIKDAGKLQAAINTLGMGDSYTVRKAEVYVTY